MPNDHKHEVQDGAVVTDARKSIDRRGKVKLYRSARLTPESLAFIAHDHNNGIVGVRWYGRAFNKYYGREMDVYVAYSGIAGSSTKLGNYFESAFTDFTL